MKCAGVLNMMENTETNEPRTVVMIFSMMSLVIPLKNPMNSRRTNGKFNLIFILTSLWVFNVFCIIDPNLAGIKKILNEENLLE